MSSDALISPRPRVFNRRTAFRFAAAGVPVLAGLALPVAVAEAATRPSGAGYSRYEDLYKSGDTLQSVLNRVTANNVLTLPEGQFTFRDFKSGYYDGIRVGTNCKGIAGSGRNTVISGVANTATRDKGGKIAGTQLTIANKSGAVLTNFTLKGSPQNGLYYGGITVNNCADAVLSNLYLRGGSRGYSQHPPGETFGINVMRSPRVTISDTEIDGRDDGGVRVAASPIGWNNTTDAKLYRVYAHHGLCGMTSFYEVTNIYTEDYRCFSTSTGSGDMTGSGMNHEQSQGVIKHVRPQLAINGMYSGTADRTQSNGFHMSYANTRQDLTNVQVVEPVWDKNIGSTGMIVLSIRDGYTIAGQKNKIKTPPKITKSGVTLVRSDHPTSGWADKDAKKYFAWVH